MKRFINCIAHKSSDGQLLIGDEFTALFDCGMMFCAEKTIQNVKNALNGRELDLIFLTHTHYDQVGALPFFKKSWDYINVVTCEAGAAALVRNSTRKAIRESSLAEAEIHKIKLNMDYNDELFHADRKVKDNDIIPLGKVSVQIFETPGHTRDSLAFFIPELKLLIINETPGILMPDGIIYPSYLTDYNETIQSIKKCSQIPYKYLSIPHYGVIGNKEADGFFKKAQDTYTACYDFILDMKNKNYTKDEMIDSYFKKYASETLLSYQSKDIFLANAQTNIASILSIIYT